MARYNLECIVLKSINYKDTDKIFTLYSKSKGKISAMARGVRRISSKRSGSLDTLNHISVSITENAAGYKTITEVKNINSFRSLKRSLLKTAKGYYLSEIVHKFIEEGHESSQIFSLLNNALVGLNSKEADPNIVVVYFEVNLMKYLGYGLSLDKCAHCGQVYSSEWNQSKFNYALGGILCGSCQGNGFPISRDVANTLNALVTPRSESFILKDAIVLGSLTEASDLIKPYIEDILEDRIKTSLIFKDTF